MRTYRDFFSEADVETFRRVKTGQMRLARIAREVACEMVGGTIPVKGKEFVTTRRGTFRLCMAANSDNTTERFAHYAMGAKTIVMGDDDAMAAWFASHGLSKGAVATFARKVRARL